MNSNNLKTLILFSILTSVILICGYSIGGGSGLIFAGFFALIINFGSYWFSDKIALSFANAHQIDKNSNPTLFEDVEDLSNKMGIPTPRIYISDEVAPNAFATGRNPKNGVVCFTSGILQMLNREELRGVIAHELAHIKNRDILISTIAAVMGGILTSFADIFMFGAIFGGNDEEGNSNPIGSIILIILAPIVAMLIQFAISRSREFEADSSAVKATGDKNGLANALLKIENSLKSNPMHVNSAMSSLYIQNPLSGGGLTELFSTHPQTSKRIENINNTSLE